MKQKTNKKMLILSCIGIILVVIGHIGSPITLAGGLFPYYSFHMALFIFISGYFYKIDNEKILFGKKGYITKKIKKLIIPYFIWNLIYGIILYILKVHDVVSFGSYINVNNFFIQPWLKGEQYILNIPAWFLLSLFIVNVTYVCIRKLFKKVWNDYVVISIFLILSLISVYISNDLSISYLPLLRTCFFLFFYQLGYVYKTKIEGKFKVNNIFYFGILILIQLILLKLDGQLSYVVAKMTFYTKYTLTPILTSLTGIFFWLKISEILIPSLGDSKVLNYIGNHTYDVMMHHLFWVFFTNFCLWKVSTIFDLSGFNVECFKTEIYYFYLAGFEQARIVYVIIALTMPSIFRYCYDKIKQYIIKNNHIIKG